MAAIEPALIHTETVRATLTVLVAIVASNHSSDASSAAAAGP